MRKTSSAALVICLIAALPAESPGAPEQGWKRQSRSAVGRAISRAWSDHIAAAQRKDLDAAMELYEQGITYAVPAEMPGSGEAHGFEAVRRLERRALEQADVLHARHTTTGLRVYGNTAWELGTVAGPILPKGGDPVDVTFHYMAQWNRGDDGLWRIRYLVGLPEEDPASGE